MKENFENAKALHELDQTTDAPMGYGCVYFNKDNGFHTDYQFHLTPSNIANFLGKHMEESDHIILTDMLDNLVCDFEDRFIMTFPNQELLQEVLPHLILIQCGEKMAVDIILASIPEVNEYSNESERKTVMTMF